MPAFKPTPHDLKFLQAGLCPSCGASVVGKTGCEGCKLDFGTHATTIPGNGPKPAARPAASAGAGPLDVDELERGLGARGLPLTGAALPEGLVDDKWLALGQALLANAHALLADAALVDDPEVLAGKPPAPTSVPRSFLNAKRTPAALVDDTDALLMSRGALPPVLTRPPVAAPPVAAPAVAPPIASPPTSAPPPPPLAAPLPPAAPQNAAPRSAAPPAFDPDATEVHDAAQIAAIAARLEAQSAEANAVTVRGRAQLIEDVGGPLE